ncbi:MAG: hypothetical protein DA408_13770 [Bacteroidetes bacterium]|nr:MAG: hypothetical protein C7N36_05835 [Bacteroidota bacterium]PTM11298.1 MAG: hypothetical protein DA408_13770 [Bacteroidota bacterium]
MKNTINATLFLLLLLACGCGSKPKVIEAESAGSDQESGSLFTDVPPLLDSDAFPATSGGSRDATLHQVVVQEVLPTPKYSYLRVKEGEEEYWLAILKNDDVKPGKTYSYTGGLLKRNFQSQEYQRVFDKVYLVSDFRAASGAPAGGVAAAAGEAVVSPPAHIPAVPGALKIADLVANIARYEGKKVMVVGKCMKINPMIMGRNWIHLQDDSGGNLDLTVTTAEQLSVGAIVTFEGTIALNKDFGAGYRYDYIMENAVLK